MLCILRMGVMRAWSLLVVQHKLDLIFGCVDMMSFMFLFKLSECAMMGKVPWSR